MEISIFQYIIIVICVAIFISIIAVIPGFYLPGLGRIYPGQISKDFVKKKIQENHKMKVTIEIQDYSNPAKQKIRIHNAWNDSGKVELEINNERYVVSAEELISAVKRATLNVFGV